MKGAHGLGSLTEAGERQGQRTTLSTFLARHRWTFAAALLVAVVYGISLSIMPKHVFWMPDEGAKLFELRGVQPVLDGRGDVPASLRRTATAAGQRVPPRLRRVPGADHDARRQPVSGVRHPGRVSAVDGPVLPRLRTGRVSTSCRSSAAGWSRSLSGVMAAWFAPPSRTVRRSARRSGHAGVVLQRRLLGAHVGDAVGTDRGRACSFARRAASRASRRPIPADPGRHHAAHRDGGAGRGARRGVGRGRRQRLAPAGHVDERSDGPPAATPPRRLARPPAVARRRRRSRHPAPLFADGSASRPSFASCRSASIRRSPGLPNIPQGLFEVFINSQNLGPARDRWVARGRDRRGAPGIAGAADSLPRARARLRSSRRCR